MIVDKQILPKPNEWLQMTKVVTDLLVLEGLLYPLHKRVDNWPPMSEERFRSDTEYGNRHSQGICCIILPGANMT